MVSERIRHIERKLGNRIISTWYILGIKCEEGLSRMPSNVLVLSVGSMMVPITEIRNSQRVANGEFGFQDFKGYMPLKRLRVNVPKWLWKINDIS